ncbi:midkine-B-like [Anguilla rostrata]|uniref:Midkine n=1 Tax=Anguilla anguilla TaxID=7936 RepID=A0A9D3RUH7_ANGAN|nr:midkine-B-like [Anguilla anguilla]KAG5840012.1 hypothetical protein ANANG_G00211630 [Anguilla anguilla]
MRVLFSVTVVLVVGLMMATAEAAKGKKVKVKGSKGASGCTDWRYGSCVPNKGDCGAGVRNGTCNGQTSRGDCGAGVQNGTCNGHTKTLMCRVPCNWKKEFGADCKYKFGSWRGCDSATSTRTRTGTLKKALYGAECKPSVTVSKPCATKTKTKTKGKKSRLREN